MIVLNPTPPDYLSGFDDVGLQNWFNYIIQLSMDSDFSSTGSTQENGFANWAEIVYNSLSFAGQILPNPEGNLLNTTNYPTRIKRLINTGYNNGVARTAQTIKCNFLLNKKMMAWSSNWGSQLTVTIPIEFSELGGGSTVNSHSCILKKVSTGGTVTTLKTLTLVNTTNIGIMRYYTFNDNTGIGTINAGDVLFIEYILTFTAPGFTNSGNFSNLSILTNWLTNLFASIP